MDITPTDGAGATVIAARTLIALVLITGAVGKLREPATFLGAVAGYRLLPARCVAPVAATIPWLELGLGLLIPTGLVPLSTAAAAATLFMAFALAMAINMLRGHRDIDCGCFLGRPAQRLTWSHVGRVTALAGAAGVALPDLPQSLDTAAEGLAAGGILFLLYVAASLLPTHARRQPRISL